jgi:hypothetical protein
MNGLSTRLGRAAAFVQENFGTVVVALLPLAIFALRPDVLNNRIGDVDTWFYFGHFTSFPDYRSFDIVFNNYYQTRLPYLIPGAAIFQLFTLSSAKLVFAYLVAAVAIGSLVFALRTQVGRTAALLATVLMISDIFFVRMIGWNYVDNGIVAYYALTIAALTAAARSPTRKALWVVVAAFCFTCMMFIHLGSAVLGLPALGYAMLVLEPEKVGMKRLLQLFLAAAVGVAASQCLFGILNVALWQSDFFFIKTQILAGRVELAAKPEWRATSDVLRDGDWLSVHLAVWITSAIALGAAALRLIRLTRFQLYCFGCVTVTYGMVYLLDANRLSVFLSRDGLYASFGFILTYMTIGGLLASLGRRAAVAIGACFLVSLIIRLTAESGLTITASAPPSWLLGVVMAAGFVVVLFARNAAIKTVAFCLSALPTLLVTTTFGSAEPIYQVHDAIRQAAGKQLPVILTDKNEPLYSNIVAPIVATFTEKAWWAHGPEFPKLPNEVWQNQKVFVISSRLKSLDEMQRLLAPQVDRIEPIGFSRNQSRFGELFVGGFEVDRRVSLPDTIAGGRLMLPLAIAAAKLPSLTGAVEGTSRSANAGQAPGGFLTYGPYAMLAPGKYQIAIEYGPSEGAQTWDIVTGDGHVIARGGFAPAVEANATVTVPLDAQGTVSGLQVRSLFSGAGHLTVRSINIRARE